MASALTVLLLGCWLAGHSRVWGQPSYPKPTITGIPSEGVSLGGSVGIWCKGQHQAVQFVLNKDGRHIQSVDSDSQALFLINNVRREDGGNYNCSYRSKSEPITMSDPSDPVELVVRDPGLPRPSISLSPTGVVASGADVTIRCQGQRRDVRFFVHKAGDRNPQQHMDPAGDGAEFRIPSVGRQHGGSYSCSYRPRSEPFVSSQPSDTVQLVVADPSLPRPSISLSPTGVTAPGADVTIRCEGQRRDVRFFLHKAGDLNPQQQLDTAGNVSEFRIPSVGWQHGGSYSCSYRPRSEPFVSSLPSDPVQLVVRDPSLPRPSISLSPTGVTAPGADVTIRCEGQRRDVRFFLHKAGDLNPQQQMDTAGNVSEFRIPSVGRQHGGSYSCSYRPRSEPFVSSLPSDPVQLVVRDPSLPRPSISLSPTGVTAPGADVTIRCEGQRRDVRFFLHKAGDLNPQQQMDTAGNVSEFRIPSVGRQHGGSYSCSYRPRSEPFVSSLPSDPVELVVRDPSLPRPSISLSPTGVTPTEADVTIRCEGQRRDVRFFLHKAGELNPQQHMDTAGNLSEFRIPSVGRQHGGSYSCSYRPRSEPFVSSLPSDPVELVVRDPSLPRPSISLSPTGVTAPGADITIRCEGQRRDVRFFLHKAGDLNPQQQMDTAGNVSEFRIPSVGRQHGGSYSCSYQPRSEPFVSSLPSDPVELVVRDPSLPRPSISLSPTGVTASEADVTIRCEGQRRDVRFFLHKGGDLNPQQQMDTAGNVSEFRIPSVGRQHGGSYSCSYRPPSEPFVSSLPSDPVELVVRDPSLPRPSISLSPTGVTAPGADVTIRCEGQRRDVRFFLHKAGELNPQQHMDPAGNVSEFRIPSVGRQHGGSYSCSYRPRSEPFVSSLPSDPVELVVRDHSLPRPNISLSPTGVVSSGADVTIWCEGQRRDVRFFVYKAGDRNPQRHMDPAGAGVEFRILSVGRQHGGSYSCSYRPRSEPFISSEPSDPMQLVVADPSLPRPSISLSPTGVTPTEADVTIRCEGQRRDVRFFLHKAGDLNAQRHMDTAGNVSEFRIPSVGRQHGGSYNCSYRPRSEPFISSQPSDPVELEVTEPTLPKPSISPSGNVSLGGSVSVRCQGLRPGVRFELNKGRRHVAHVDTERLAFVFPINNIQREQGGNYSCSHHHSSEPFTEWSDSVELVVRG